VLAALQPQTATLQSSQELQAAANAQIMTSMAYLSDSMTKQQEPANNLDDEEEDHDEEEIYMDKTD